MDSVRVDLIKRQLDNTEAELNSLKQGSNNFTPETLKRLQMQLVTIISQNDFLNSVPTQFSTIPDNKLKKQHVKLLLNLIKESIKQELN